VQKGLAQEDPAIKRSALTALGSILEGPDPQMISSFLVECTENILKCAAHSDALLRECACWCVSRICETLPQFVLSNEMFERYCNCLIEQLKVTTKSANHACLSFYYLTRITHHKTTALGVSLLSQPKYFVPIIGSLWEIFFRPESISSALNLCSSALLAIINIINFTNCNSSFIGQLIQKSLQFINETTTEAAHGKPHIEEYQAYFTSILYNCLEKAKSSVQPSDAQQILSIIFNVFRARNSTYDEGFLTISVIATLMGQEFEKYLSVLVPFIENAFSNAKDIPLIRTACLCLNETSRAVKEKMEPFLPNLIGLLVKFLSDSDADREIKILAFESIGDIALSVSAHFTNYVEPLMKVFISAADISLVPFQSDDIDEANDYEDYIDRLISSLLDCSTSMVLCMKDANSTVLIQPYIEGLVKYCIEVGKKYGNKQRDTWKERMKQALGVIADLASVSSPCLRLLEQNGTNLGQIMIDIIKTEMTPDEADEIKYIEQSIMTK
jgi:importin subunit beta-1